MHVESMTCLDKAGTPDVATGWFLSAQSHGVGLDVCMYTCAITTRARSGDNIITTTTQPSVPVTRKDKGSEVVPSLGHADC